MGGEKIQNNYYKLNFLTASTAEGVRPLLRFKDSCKRDLTSANTDIHQVTISNDKR